jgi:hypothetical protein
MEDVLNAMDAQDLEALSQVTEEEYLCDLADGMAEYADIAAEAGADRPF